MEALRRERAQIQRYRQSVLQAAVTGRLTVDWREAHPEAEPAEKLFRKIGKSEFKGISNQEPTALVSFARDLSDLPETWILSNIGTASEVIMGQSPPGDSYNQDGFGVPLINGPVEFGPTPFSKTLKTKFTTEPKKMCKENDLILCVRGSTTGRMNISGFDGCVGRGVARCAHSLAKNTLIFTYILCSIKYLNWVMARPFLILD